MLPPPTVLNTRIWSNSFSSKNCSAGFPDCLGSLMALKTLKNQELFISIQRENDAQNVNNPSYFFHLRRECNPEKLFVICLLLSTLSFSSLDSQAASNNFALVFRNESNVEYLYSNEKQEKTNIDTCLIRNSGYFSGDSYFLIGGAATEKIEVTPGTWEDQIDDDKGAITLWPDSTRHFNSRVDLLAKELFIDSGKGGIYLRVNSTANQFFESSFGSQDSPIDTVEINSGQGDGIYIRGKENANDHLSNFNFYSKNFTLTAGLANQEDPDKEEKKFNHSARGLTLIWDHNFLLESEKSITITTTGPREALEGKGVQAALWMHGNKSTDKVVTLRSDSIGITQNSRMYNPNVYAIYLDSSVPTTEKNLPSFYLIGRSTISVTGNTSILTTKAHFHGNKITFDTIGAEPQKGDFVIPFRVTDRAVAEIGIPRSEKSEGFNTEQVTLTTDTRMGILAGELLGLSQPSTEGHIRISAQSMTITTGIKPSYYINDNTGTNAFPGALAVGNAFSSLNLDVGEATITKSMVGLLAMCGDMVINANKSIVVNSDLISLKTDKNYSEFRAPTVTIESAEADVTLSARGYGIFQSSGKIEIKAGLGTISVSSTEGSAIRLRNYGEFGKEATEKNRGYLELSGKNVKLASHSSQPTVIVTYLGNFEKYLNRLIISASDTLTIENPENTILFAEGTGNGIEATAASGFLSGKIEAKDGSAISLMLSERGSLNGSTSETETEIEVSNTKRNYGKGIVSLMFANQAIWNVTENCGLTNLTLSNGGTLDLTSQSPEEFLTVETKNLNPVSTYSNAQNSSTGGLVRARVDFLPRESDGLGDTDKLIITETASGKHVIDVVKVNADKFADGTEPIEISDYIVRDASGQSDWALNTSTGTTIDVGNLIYVHSLESKTDEETGAKDWYLVHTGTRQRTISIPWTLLTPAIFSPAAESVLAMAGMGAQQMTYLAGLSDLRKRLGEVRMDAQEGLWVQMAADKSRLSGLSDTRFKQTQYRFNLGLDYKHNNWLYGINLKYSNSDQKTCNSLYKAKADAHSYGLNLYATWFNESGSYVDLVGTVDKYHSRLKTASLVGRPLKASFRNLGLGFSIETGHKFELGSEKDWFVEPQFQLSYYFVKGDDFSVSNGMKVKQDNFHSGTGRIGLVAGKDWFGSQGEKKAQLYVKTGLKQGFFGDQKLQLNNKRFDASFSGTRVYYGLGADWQIKKNLKAYLQFEREHGKHYTKEIEGSVGIKYQF